MASANGEEEYESDPEEAKLSLAMRRRVASDDEEEDGDGGERRGDEVPNRNDIRASDEEESDDQGAPEDYDEEEMDREEELEDVDEELVRVEDVRRHVSEVANVEIVNEGRELLVGEIANGQDVLEGEDQVEGEEGKKEHEPFAVPTAGAFYMHDDRFRDNAAGRHRRTLGARKLWESRDERRWGHDKFEELTSQDSRYSESRRNRGRGRNRGTGRGYVKGDKSKVPGDNDNQVTAPTSVRGRGPRRYDPAYKRRSEVPQTQNQNKQLGRHLEKAVHSNSTKGLESASTVTYEAAPGTKNLVASNLNSASPPFYPSGSSSNDQNLATKKDVQPPKTDRNHQQFSVDQSLGLNKLYLGETGRKPSNSSHVQPSGLTNSSQGPQVRAQGRGQGYAGHVPSQVTPHPPSHASKASGAHQHPTQRGPIQNRTQPYSRAPEQPVPKQIGNGSQASSSPPRVYASQKSFESGEDSKPESGKAKTAIVGSAASGVQGGGALGPFMYNGAQIMGATGNMGVAHGDPNFPTFLPVMQFGAQHPGGIGVPAVGMAFPGYVQPQHGQGSSEMTWLPVLAGAAGALGAAYCSPYMLDGANYNPQLTGPSSAASSSNKEANTNKALNEWNPSQKLEHASEESEQRQNKPRRYSEMKFGQ
ncbi:hypothetical protein QQ045_016320 [Rhodiola kirilowii]